MDAGLPVVIEYKRDAAGNIVQYKCGLRKGKPVAGMNAPNLVTLPTENSPNLLHFNSGPVAQKDRAAVS